MNLNWDSPLAADDIMEFGLDHVVLAFGATWRRDGVDRFNLTPVLRGDEPNVLTLTTFWTVPT